MVSLGLLGGGGGSGALLDSLSSPPQTLESPTFQSPRSLLRPTPPWVCDLFHHRVFPFPLPPLRLHLQDDRLHLVIAVFCDCCISKLAG